MAQHVFTEIFLTNISILSTLCGLKTLGMRTIPNVCFTYIHIFVWRWDENENIFGNLAIFNSTTLKFIYSEKATKFWEISTLLFSYVVPVKSKVEISQNFVAFSEYMNFTWNETWIGLNSEFVLILQII